MIKAINKKAAAVKVFCLLFAFLLVSGCVTTEETNRLRWEVNELRTEVKNIKQTSKSIETQIPGQQKQVIEKVRELEESQQAASKNVSDLLIRIEYMTTELQMLTGRFEEARYQSEKNSAELNEIKEMLIAKMKQLETSVADLEKRLGGPRAADTPKAGDLKTAPKVAEKEAEKAPEHKDDDSGKEVKKEDAKKDTAAEKGIAEKKDDDAKDLYMAAYEAYKEDRTVEAREMFQSLLMDHAENEYSDNARFWIAESFYKDENYEDAILAYEELFKKNPDSDKLPGAMLKQGLAFYALKDSKTGQIILEKLIEKYPDSDQAKLAIKKMNKAVVPPKKK